MNRVARYIGARLHRRLFLTFGMTILVSAGLIFGLVHAMSGDPSWRREAERARVFVAHRFAESWSDRGARARLAQSTAADLDVDLTLYDNAGTEIGAAGMARCDAPKIIVPVAQGGQALGSVGICATRHGSAGGWRFGLSALIGIAVLWGASGGIARRLTRPLVQVARVAEDIGRGKLSSRVRVGRHHHGEVRVLADAINEMAARIEKQLADQRALLATVSHEIRTPLARIRLHAEFARQKSGDSKALDDIDREVVDIDALVSDLLASSRIDFTALTRRTLDATQIAQQAVERTGIDPSKLVVDAPHVAFDGDPTLVIRAVTNLLENAMRHGGGVELFRVSTRGHFVTFEVEDAGEGFAKGEEERVFEPFYQHPKGGEAAAHSVGLGLTLVKRIAEAHGGRAYAANRAEGGARVGMDLVKL